MKTRRYKRYKRLRRFSRNRGLRQKGGADFPQKVWCVWVGGTPMSETRSKAFQSIKDTVGVEVELVTDETLPNYIKADAPFHEAYQYLSATHKCDYIRGYLMHNYGGGYTDIKITSASWKPFFDELAADPNLWGIGCEAEHAGTIAPAINNEALTQEMKDNYTKIIGVYSYILRPGTEFTTAWMSQVNSELDKYLPELKIHPAKHARNGVEGNSSYPIPWAGILGSIFYPLAYKFSEHFGKNLPRPQFTNYL
jgi:hypothetical protein